MLIDARGYWTLLSTSELSYPTSTPYIPSYPVVTPSSYHVAPPSSYPVVPPSSYPVAPQSSYSVVIPSSAYPTYPAYPVLTSTSTSNSTSTSTFTSTSTSTVTATVSASPYPVFPDNIRGLPECAQAVILPLLANSICNPADIKCVCDLLDKDNAYDCVAKACSPADLARKLSLLITST
jgi:uncharacterized membrane protein